MKKNFVLAGVVALILCASVFSSSARAVVSPFAAVPTDINGTSLKEGDLISVGVNAGDPDIFIVKLLTNNADQRSPEVNGYKRLFLNPAIFAMYAHLGGFANVHTVTPAVRDSFETSGIFRNCETGDQAVWATEVTGEDMGILHHVQLSGDEAVQQDRYFFSKVFCINSREEAFYPKSIEPYLRLSDIPPYNRAPTPNPQSNPGNSTASSRNAQRRQNINSILNALSQRTLDNFGVWHSDCGGETVMLPVTATFIGTAELNLSQCLVPDFISVVPADPSDGTSANTGYTVMRDSGGFITVAAPGAELGEVITVTR